MKIAITGASGFVGKALIQSLAQSEHSVVALSRSSIPDLPKNAEWRHCELFSSRSTGEALRDADIVFYLVHSMLPSSRLFQGDFRDTDLLIADNIAKACENAQVQHIIYLGGIVPEGHISEHLESRQEVEGVLQATGIPTTVFRAGMVVGSGGSSFEILKTLVLRLPAMVLPHWTESKTQAIHIEDVVRVFMDSINNPKYRNRVLDLVNGEKLIYKDLLTQTAKGFGLKRFFLPVPIRSTGFSKLWVTIFGNSNYSLVSPLIDSLLCDLPQPEPSSIYKDKIHYKSYLEMIKDIPMEDRKNVQTKRKIKTSHRKSVRSIQRLPSLENVNSDWISREYMRWLPKKFRSLIRVKIDESTGIVEFKILFLPKPILVLQYIPGKYEEDRQKFHIIGGILSKTTDTGWLEFRQVQNKRYTLTAIHEFVPSLPWYIYINSQAILHKYVMHSFGRYLARIPRTSA